MTATVAEVLIAGAGIGGLAAALALARAGATVSVIERASELQEVGAGLQLSPNATRVLATLGVLDRLAEDALRPTGIRVRAARSSATVAVLPLADAEQRWGAPYLVAHRADLLRALTVAVADDPAITLFLGTALAGLGTSDAGIKATVKQGPMTRVMDADILIGADGLRSTVRARLVDADDAPTETGRTAWRALIPADAVDPGLTLPETNLWLGREAHLVHYPLRGGRQVNVVAITQGPKGATAPDLWSAPGDPAAITARFRSWHKGARELIAAAPSWTTWPIFDRAPLARWHAGRIALLGDAAHPVLPFLAQGSAQAIEDAAALAAAFGATRDLPAALANYSQDRQSRAARVQQTSRDLGRIYHLAGPAAAARNLGMRMIGGQRLLARYNWLYGA